MNVEGSRQPSWLASANVSWRFCLLAALLWSGLWVVLYRSPVGDFLEQRFASPLNFQVRHKLGKDVALSSRIKVYGVDDATVFKLKGPVLSGKNWADLLTTLAKSQPQGIFIDGMMSRADEHADTLIKALTALREQGIPVTVGSFMSPKAIDFGSPLEMRPEYDLKAMEDPGEAQPAASAPIASRLEWTVYGPDPLLRRSLSFIGHILYDGNGLTAPLFRLNQIDREHAVPLAQQAAVGHVALYLSKQRLIREGRLMLDSGVVPLRPDGYLTVNMLHPQAFYSDVLSVWGLLEKAQKGQRSSVVEPGDIVFIVPQFYTGNADFKQTPFGPAPGALVIASMLNSVATGQWLKQVEGTEAFVLAFGVLGAGLGLYLGVAAFWTGVAALALGFFALSQGLFAFQGIMLPWLLPLLSLLTVALTVFAEKTRLGEQRVRILRAALAGSVAPEELTQLLKRPEQISFEARERVVTLMFIDIVGFSLRAEHMLPRLAFDHLKRILMTLGATVHEFGGVIDKTLGDGLLCYFGYRFDADVTAPDHAERALACAIKIQEENLRRNLEAAEQKEPVYPLRIGINTASCYLGDLGSDGRIDFTVVGNGVNFAKRLEGACAMYSVLMGPSTFDLVKASALPGDAFHKRFIRIKHHKELVESYEYDPFFKVGHLRQAALAGFHQYAQIDPGEKRWPVHDASRILLATNLGAGSLVSFANGSLAIKLAREVSRGERLQVRLDSPDGTLRSQLAPLGMESLEGEVRWGYSEGHEFVHGLILPGLTAAQQEALVTHLCEVAFAATEAASILPHWDHAG